MYYLGRQFENMLKTCVGELRFNLQFCVSMQAKFESILSDIASKEFKPVYVLAGEEPYFIDVVVDAIEASVLSPDEKEFNFSLLYGQDIEVETLLSECKMYPMMSERRVVIVKEAKSLKGFDKLADYMQNPVMTTILVLAHKHKDLDKRLQVTKRIIASKEVLYLESNKLRENEIVGWIQKYTKQHQLNMDAKAMEFLKEFVGNDLGKLANEMEKLSLFVGPGNRILPEHVLDHIGLSREFNIFELQKALAAKNLKRSVSIAIQMGKNKNTNILQIIPTLYGFFSKGLLLKYETAVGRKNFEEACAAIGISYMQKPDMQELMRNYTVAQLKNCIRELGMGDLYAKGIQTVDMDEPELMRNMVLKFLF